MSHFNNRLLPALAVLAAALVNPLIVQAEDAGPAAVVARFNKAVSDRDMETAMAELADGSVQIQLRAAHPGMSNNPPLTADLRKNWQMVGAILFPVTDSYERRVEITDVQELGEVATVWSNTVTETHRKNVAEPMIIEFSEVYLLVKKDGEWKIAANADNRAPDNIVVGTENG